MADHEAPVQKNPLISDGLYTKLEYMARVVLPAFAALYVALATIWGFPYGPEVVGTVTAVDAFLGIFLGFAMKSYDASPAKYDGDIVILNTQDGGKTFSLELDKHPEELAQMSQVVFKVNTGEVPAS
jgi:hypothetical protein